MPKICGLRSYVTGIPEERTERMRKRCDSEMMAETQQKHKGGNLQGGQTR